MSEHLLHALRNHFESRPRKEGVRRTAIPGLYTIRMSRSSELQHVVRRPTVCLIAQGVKKVALGGQTRECEPGQPLLIRPESPALSRVRGASSSSPYLAIAYELDPATTAELSIQMRESGADVASLRSGDTDKEVAETAARMLRLLEHPPSVPMLQKQLGRELQYWLLVGRHGADVLGAGTGSRNTERIARAIALIRLHFRSRLPSQTLATAAGMSASAFYQGFREITSTSPLQFQKRLRLTEARRLLVSSSVRVSEAAFAVGYESVPQFIRDYRRCFGSSPGCEAGVAKPAVRKQ